MRCECCGRFFRYEPGCAWKMVYSGVIPEPDHELYRCRRCVEAVGPFDPDPRIKPECSCGIVRASAT